MGIEWFHRFAVAIPVANWAVGAETLALALTPGNSGPASNPNLDPGSIVNMRLKARFYWTPALGGSAYGAIRWALLKVPNLWAAPSPLLTDEALKSSEEAVWAAGAMMINRGGGNTDFTSADLDLHLTTPRHFERAEVLQMWIANYTNQVIANSQLNLDLDAYYHEDTD